MCDEQRFDTYAVPDDVRSRMTREMSADEEEVCNQLLEDASVMIDRVAPTAPRRVKALVACRMVIRALGDGSDAGLQIPAGATQGSMSALGYSQSWTIGSGGGAGELYLGKAERHLLGVGNRIGSYSPAEELVPEVVP